MSVYVAFLRAINLGARRKFPKDAIIAATEAAGFTGVSTHINTGNVRFETPMRSRSRIEKALETAYADDRGFEVPTLVFTPAEVVAIADEAARLSADRPDLARHYIYLLKDEPEPDRVAAVAEKAAADGRLEVVVADRAAHVLIRGAVNDGVVDPVGVEKALGVVATNRNVNVVTTLARKWCD